MVYKETKSSYKDAGVSEWCLSTLESGQMSRKAESLAILKTGNGRYPVP